MLTHIDGNGNAKMVNISKKEITQRLAIASGKITMSSQTLVLVKSQGHKKGDVLTVAKIAAIQAAKNTSSLIPMCHPIALTSIDIEFKIHENKLIQTATFRPRGLLGRIYWYCVLPFHSYIFNGMLLNLTKEKL